MFYYIFFLCVVSFPLSWCNDEKKKYFESFWFDWWIYLVIGIIVIGIVVGVLITIYLFLKTPPLRNKNEINCLYTNGVFKVKPIESIDSRYPPVIKTETIDLRYSPVI